MIMSPGRGGSLSPTYFLTVGPTIGGSGSSSGGGGSVDDIRLPLGGLERQQERPELQGQPPPPPQQEQQHEEGEEIAIPKKGKPSPAAASPTFTNARKAGEREERVRKEERGGSTSSPSPKKAGARKSLPIGGVGAGHLSPLASRRSMSDRSASKRGR